MLIFVYTIILSVYTIGDKMGRPGRKRLSVDLLEGMHQEITYIAKTRHMQITEVVKRALTMYIEIEKTRIIPYEPERQS